MALLFAVASLGASWAELPGIAPFEGQWNKHFIIDKGARTQDPRWELVLHFGPQGKFSYLSRSTTEVRLSNGNARPMVDEIRIAGRWSIDKEGRITIELDRAPTAHEVPTLEANLGYDRKLGTATVNPDFEGKLMRVNGVGRDRRLFFRKAN
jgi:hypothetical protein